jgi:hypothetical protein
MEIKGQCIAVLPMQTGTGKNGKEWKSQDFVIETSGQYPKKVCINLFGDKITLIPNIGQQVTAHIEIESREYNERWFTTVRAWKIDNGQTGIQSTPVSLEMPEPSVSETDGTNEMPF